MENKKLINILIKDMHELETLIADFKSEQEHNLPELEYIQTKATGIRQLLEIFRLQNSGEKEITPDTTDHSSNIPPSPKVTEEPVSEEEEPVRLMEPENEPEPPGTEEEHEIGSPETETEEKVPEPASEEDAIEEKVGSGEKEEVPVEERESPTEDETPEPEPEPEVSEPEPQGIEDKTEEEAPDEVELQETEEEQKERQVLSDRFQKDKSINDMISGGSEKLEHKLSMRPVSSIKSAIGINDRFLFTRELFDGNADLYNKAVTTLDGFSNIKEAVAYLRDNFKWKKNETSLKFVGLVKRRFMDE